MNGLSPPGCGEAAFAAALPFFSEGWLPPRKTEAPDGETKLGGERPEQGEGAGFAKSAG
ncbi:hypothetical protein [Dysosmobacter sp.]